MLMLMLMMLLMMVLLLLPPPPQKAHGNSSNVIATCPHGCTAGRNIAMAGQGQKAKTCHPRTAALVAMPPATDKNGQVHN